MSRSLAAFILMFTIQRYAFAQLQVTSGFPGGSAVVVSVDASQKAIHIQPEVHQDRGWPCWWYCRLDGLAVGEPVEVAVSANPTPFRDKWVLDSKWMLPDRASISDDNVDWKHTEQGDRKAKSATYVFEASAETMWIAWGPPFLSAPPLRLRTGLKCHRFN